MTHRKRITPTWSPIWTIETERRTAKLIRANLWRFDPLDGFDDVMQEAKILFWTLWRKYPIVKEAAHFSALFHTSMQRKIIDKARRRLRSAIDQEVNAEEVAEEMQLEGNMPNSGYLNLLLEEMPDELKLVLEGLTGGRIRLKLDTPTTSIRPRENDNMRLKRRFSFSTVDPVGDLRGYFANS